MGLAAREILLLTFFSECGTEEVPTGFWWRDLMKTDHLEDLSAEGRIILKNIQEVGLDCCGSEWGQIVGLFHLPTVMHNSFIH